jgi:hypothetical protein
MPLSVVHLIWNHPYIFEIRKKTETIKFRIDYIIGCAYRLLTYLLRTGHSGNETLVAGAVTISHTKCKKKMPFREILEAF